MNNKKKNNKNEAWKIKNESQTGPLKEWIKEIKKKIIQKVVLKVIAIILKGLL